MSGMNRNEKVAAATAIAQERAREAAARVKPAAAQVKPLAKSTQDAAMRSLVRSRAWAAPRVERTRIWAAPRVERTRIWAAPRVERTGQVLQDTVAPKVADMLSSAAQRIEPEKPRSRNWWTLSGIAILVAAGAAAAAAAIRKRSSSSRTSEEAGADATGEVPGAPEPSTNADSSRAGRTS